MAMDIEEELKNEKKPDISFLKPKRTKLRSDLRSPFGGEAPSNEERSIPSPENLKEHSSRDSHVRNGAETVKKTLPTQKLKQDVDGPEAIVKSHEKLTRKTPSGETGKLQKIIKELGPAQTIHLLLLAELADSDGKFSKTNNDIADYLSVSRSSVKRILADLIRNGFIHRMQDSDPGSKAPAIYRLSVQSRLKSAIREALSL